VKKPPASPSTERKSSAGKPGIEVILWMLYLALFIAAAADDPMAEMLARIKSGNVHLRRIETATSVSCLFLGSCCDVALVFGCRRRRNQKMMLWLKCPSYW